MTIFSDEEQYSWSKKKLEDLGVCCRSSQYFLTNCQSLLDCDPNTAYGRSQWFRIKINREMQQLRIFNGKSNNFQGNTSVLYVANFQGTHVIPQTVLASGGPAHGHRKSSNQDMVRKLRPYSPIKGGSCNLHVTM
ncbi:hypothetical protein VNO77_26770 [Canavalia gladiata]|uniref:Uncharacterized protein n=1 Tax=Canavalia gladiata TaxID=3824 RepID=A0AAN9KXM7_CANGL